MTITTKPKTSRKPDEAIVQKLINKGGSVAAATPEKSTQLSSVLLRIPADMLAQIDASVKRRHPIRISRQTWIIEALYARLRAEEKDIDKI
ncbi:MAG: hypothetical protein P4L42_00845 [Desulfocapsaceae bacterium]|nr:hypothetical protein [Desulfocapsaceae bacterium]